MRRAVLLLGLGFAILAWVSSALAAKRVALVIGISDYTTLSKLKNPVSDAKAMAEALKGHGFEVTEYYDLPRAELLDALEEFSSVADQASVALVYYAGHGMEMAGKNVLAPKDMEIDCEKKTPKRALDLDQLFYAVAGAPQQILLLDACRNDPFPQCPKRSLGGGGGFRGFTRVGAEDRSLLIANSTLGGQLADDGVPGRHSPFAAALLARFSTDASSYLRDLLEDVAGDVQRASDGGQVPEILTRGGAVRVCLDEVNCGGIAVASGEERAKEAGHSIDAAEQRKREGEFAYFDCVRTNDSGCYKKFLNDFFDHPRARQVEKIIASRSETPLYQTCLESSTATDRITACQAYLDAFPDGQHAIHVKELLDQGKKAVPRIAMVTPPPQLVSPSPEPSPQAAPTDVRLDPPLRADSPRPRGHRESCGRSNTTLYCASSVLSPQKGNYYGPRNVFDGNSNTAWVEGAGGQGIGEFVVLEFDVPRTVREITIRNGYAKNSDIYGKNGRVRDVELRFSNGDSMDATLSDVLGAQSVSLNRPERTKWVQIIIRSVYPGWKYSDTAINEIRAN
jgi:hypothetical protein